MMKLFIFVALAVIGGVSANCGCLKCSKHLSVAGEVPGAAGYGPIKVIYRAPGSTHGCGIPDSLPISVQKPIEVPQVPFSCGGEHGYQVQEFYKPVCFEQQYTHPIKVQAPVPIPPVAACIPLTGLKANIDRVILPCPPTSRQYNGRYNSIYKDCPRLLRERERTSCSNNPYTASAPGPILEALYDNDRALFQDRGNTCSCNACSSCNGGAQSYYGQRYNFFLKSRPTRDTHPRTKRQLPFLDHGYKFMVNMLPPFIQEPLKHSVNIMALTHPDKKLNKFYSQPPKQTLQEKLADQHKKNVAMLKEKLYGPSPIVSKKSYYTKNSIADKVIREEAAHFLNTLHEPTYETRNRWSPKMLSRNSDHEARPWLKEMRTKDILEDEDDDGPDMSEYKKALLLLKLKKLNVDNNARFKKDINEAECRRKKRSVVIDSEEFELPLYQIRLRDSNEVGDSDEDESYADYSEEETVGRSRNNRYDDSREEMLRRAIKEELRKFKKAKESEEVVASPFQYDKMVPHSPIFHLLTLPMKLLGSFNGMNQQSLVGSVPKMIVGTKKYFRDFGKNFKKNALHFASDVLGDFDHHGPTDHVLSTFLKPRRYRRSLDEGDCPKNLEQYEPEYSLDWDIPATSQNFRDSTETKVRKKRYVVRMLDDDEVEEIVRAKLGKIFNDYEDSYRPRKKTYKKKYTEDDCSEEALPKTYQRRRKYDSCESDEDLRKKIVVEKLRPKIIIDNNGLPFMELNGYKRPLFLKPKRGRKKMSSSTEDHTNINYGSSEEADSQKINNLIHDAQNEEEMLQSTHHNNMPMQTLKEKLSLLLFETDVLVHMNFEKYDDIYDDLIELQYIKNSIVQDWKRLVMQKKINDKDSKIALLGKFKEMQRIKEVTMINVVNALYIDSENRFVVKELTKMLVKLQKFQCIINQVVECFQEHFKMGTKFDMPKEIKFVDFLSSINFVKAKTRNDLIAILKEDRDCQLQENIQQLEKLKKLLVAEDSEAIQDEAHLLWEMKNIEQMQKANIEEMYQRTDCGEKIRKNLKILFDLSKRLQTVEEKEKRFHNAKTVSAESEEEVEVSIEDKKSIKIKHPAKKFDIEDFKKNWQDKIDKQKMLFQKNMKKNLMKLKKGGSCESNE